MAYPANEYAQLFLSHREPLLELLTKIPNDKSDFTIYPGGLSITAQVDQLFRSEERRVGKEC